MTCPTPEQREVATQRFIARAEEKRAAYRKLSRLGKLRQWFSYVIAPNVYPKRWQDRLFKGHINVGPITIYGANAMHWAVNIQFKDAYWCFHPRTRTFGGKWPAYFYVSRDATPQTATFTLGDCYD